MFFSSRNLYKAVLCIGKELSAVINSPGESKSKLFKRTVCKELRHQAPHLLPQIYVDQIEFNLTEGIMAIYGDGQLKKKTLRLSGETLNSRRGSPRSVEEKALRVHTRGTQEELSKLKLFFSQKAIV